MADDGKTINFNAHFSEDGPNQPSSAGAQLNNEQAKKDEALNRENARRAQESSENREAIKDIFEAIRRGDDTPLDGPPAGGGSGGNGNIPPPSGPPPSDEPNYGAHNGAMVPYTGGGALESTAGTEMQVAGTNTAIGPVAAAGQTAATTAGAAAGTAATAGGLAALLPVIGEVTLIVAAFSATVLLATAALNSFLRELEDTWDKVSAGIQAARGLQQVELINKQIETAPRIEDENALVTSFQTSVLKEIIEIKTSLYEIIAPVLVLLLGICKLILMVLNLILLPLRLVAEAITFIQSIVNAFWERTKIKWPWTNRYDPMESEQAQLGAGHGQFDTKQRAYPKTPPRLHKPKNP